jgi:hypothetical protein
MYLYTIEAMRGQKAKSEGNTSIKYRIKRVNTNVLKTKKGHSEFIRDNLDYEEAGKLIKGFNEVEGNRRAIDREEARRQ